MLAMYGVSPRSDWRLWFVTVAAIALLTVGLISLGDTVALRNSETVVNATVADARTMLSKYGVSHELRYTFQVPGDPRVHTRADRIGRADLWSTLPEKDWAEAIATRRVRVRYVQGHPDNNAPDTALPKLTDDFAALGLGAVFLGIAGVAFWRSLRRASTAGSDRLRSGR